MKIYKILLTVLVSSMCVQSVSADELDISAFPKMKEVQTAVYQGIGADSKIAKHIIRVLQGIVNRDSAELFLDDGSNDTFWFKEIGKSYRRPAKRYTTGENPALRTLFGEYKDRITKLVVCDFSTASYTWNMAVNMASLENALPVSEDIKNTLLELFPDWNGEVVDIRNNWSSTKEAYEWAIENLLPKMNHQLVFSTGMRDDWKNGEWKVYDYAVATRSFSFFLDNHTTEGADLIRRILREGGYGKNTTVMGYGMHGDDLNDTTNPEGFGYVVGDFIPNLSFYSSVPSRRFEKRIGKSVEPDPTKVYVALHFSDGDNIQFDHNSGLSIYQNSERGKTPISMTLAPALTELAPFILDYYYRNATENDEFIGGPSGFQYIQEALYKSSDYDEWCRKNGIWLNQAGMNMTASSLKWPVRPSLDNGFLKTNTPGTLAWTGGSYQPAYDWFGMPVVGTGGVCTSTTEVVNYLAGLNPDGAPIFTGVYCVQAGFGSDAYNALNKARETLEAEYPDKYVFLLASDLIATAKTWFESERSAYKELNIPGTVEAENFDNGGEGISYGNPNGSTYTRRYRKDTNEVYIKSGQTGYYVTSQESEWLAYTVNVEDAGTYKMSLNLTVPNDGLTAAVIMDGEFVGTVDAAASSSFEDYSFFVNIPQKGKHEMRVYFYQAGVNLDYVKFEKSESVVASIDSNDTYRLIAKHSGKALCPISVNSNNGTNIVQKTSDDESSLWNICPVADGYYSLQTQASGLYMTCRAGKRVQQYEFDNTSTLQYWTINYVDDRYFTLGAYGTGKVVAVSNSSNAENATLELVAPTQADNQLFCLENVTLGIAPLQSDCVRGVYSDDAMYNLSGQKVNPSYKGLVIKAGRVYINR